MSVLSELLEASPSLKRLQPFWERAALSEAPVLIVGEAGTGRTSFARALHDVGARADGPLVELDVAVVPSTLFESELFGHRAGAFTGADRSRPGKAARAEGGTLLLDQVEELPLSAQPKLLRLLAERRYSPLGGSETEADVRFIATASSELSSRVESGGFRQDLYYRLEVLGFELPPLRHRIEDLPTLARSLLEDLCRRQRRQLVLPSAESLQWMIEYSWPGNLRELRNLLERALLLHGSHDPRHDSMPLPSDELHVPPTRLARERRPRSLLEIELEAIRSALEYTRGHQGRAADVLGISRKALWEKRRRHGLP